MDFSVVTPFDFEWISIIHYINREQQPHFLRSLFLQNFFRTVKMRDINQTEIPNIY